MRRCGALLIALATAAYAGAKQDAAGAQGLTRMVRLNVAVEGSHGKAAPMLDESDVQVFDGGKAQKIVLFRSNLMRQRKPDAPLKPGEVTNLDPGMPRQVTVILFDLLNTRLDAQGYMRGQLLNALNKVEDADSAYLYLLTLSGLLPVQPLPEPGEDAPPHSAVPWTRQAQRKLDAAMQSVSRLGPQSDNVLPWDRFNATYSSLETMVTRLAGVAGRKNLIWITRGVPLEYGQRHPQGGTPVDYEPILRQVSAQLDESGVAVYPVESFGPMRETSGSMMEEVQTLEEIAGMTGGATYEGGDVSSALRDALAASRSSYVVGYYPPPENWDGKLHKIKLKCPIKGVKLQGKTQYVAYSLEAGGGAAEGATLRAAVRSPFDASEIGMQGMAAPDAKDTGKTKIRLRIRTQDLMLLEGGGRYHGEIALTYVSYGAGGQVFPSHPVPVTIDLSAAQEQEAMKSGIVTGGEIAFGADVRKVRVIVFDNYSDAVGSVTLPLGGGKAGG
jgi:VWFA-related protein